MTATTAEPVSGQRGVLSGLIHRQLDSYPNNGPRVMYLAITVLATITLYYELYVGGSVATLILSNLKMSFTFYVVTVAFGNLLGAFGSLFAGVTDRYGRANMVVFGLLFSGVFVTFILPAATNKWTFTIESFVVGVVEGICLVATPALIRDFSPQIGRATAMGFWTSGPVLGSLIVAIVGSITIPTGIIANQRFWTHEFRIGGVVGLVVFLIALFGLRELSPQLRDQLMVTLRDRALIEARAKGLDVEALMKNHWRQLLKPDIIVSALAVSIMLLIYYALVGFLVIFAQTVFHFTLNQANNLGYWCWAFNAGAVILVGMTSDRFRVRKPFMVIGGVGAAVMIVLFLLQSKVYATTGHPSFATIAAILAVMLFFLGVAYTPWMASFTETVEHYNPAAVATGLAIWGWIIRVVVFASSLLLLVVINTVTPLVNYGGQVAAYSAKYPAFVWAGSHGKVLAEAQQYAAPLTFAATHPAIIAIVKQYPTQLANSQKFAPELAVMQANPALFTQAAKYPTNKIPAALLAKLIKAAGGGAQGISMLTTIGANTPAILGVIAVKSQLLQLAPYAAQLTALSKVPASVIADVTAPGVGAELAQLQSAPPAVTAFMKAHGGDVASAAAKSPSQWRTWYWICFGGIIVFLLSIPLLRGRWRPSDAKRDEEEHEAMMQAELAKLQDVSA
ncbi:MAG TPA: MFS transporter [Streptosporangiaceae bacterium]|nr:MFS transporter [Streptosporangiaceae bacterium]